MSYTWPSRSRQKLWTGHMVRIQFVVSWSGPSSMPNIWWLLMRMHHIVGRTSKPSCSMESNSMNPMLDLEPVHGRCTDSTSICYVRTLLLSKTLVRTGVLIFRPWTRTGSYWLMFNVQGLIQFIIILCQNVADPYDITMGIIRSGQGAWRLEEEDHTTSSAGVRTATACDLDPHCRNLLMSLHADSRHVIFFQCLVFYVGNRQLIHIYFHVGSHTSNLT